MRAAKCLDVWLKISGFVVMKTAVKCPDTQVKISNHVDSKKKKINLTYLWVAKMHNANILFWPLGCGVRHVQILFTAC